MQVKEFSSGRTVTYLYYKLFADNGKFAGIEVSNDLKGRLYRRNEGEVNEKLYREIIKILARDNPTVLKAFMDEIREDTRFYGIALNEVRNMIRVLKGIVD